MVYQLRQGGGPITLLLIEDDVPVACLPTRAFADEGHQTTLSLTSEEGLRCLKRGGRTPFSLPFACQRSMGSRSYGRSGWRIARGWSRRLPVMPAPGSGQRRVGVDFRQVRPCL